MQQVFSGSPADQAGIQPGDVILQADGKTFNNVKDLHNYIASKKPGDTIRLNVWSQGVKKFVAIKLSETPAAQPKRSSSRSSNSNSPKAATQPEQKSSPQSKGGPCNRAGPRACFE